MISPERYEELAKAIVEASERANIDLIRALRRAAEALLNAPRGRSAAALAAFKSELRRVVRRLGQDWLEFRTKDLPRAYVEGVAVADEEVRSLRSVAVPTAAAVTSAPFGRATGNRLPPGVRDFFRGMGLSDPLITPYQVFDAAARRAMGESLLAVTRSANDAIRQVSIAAGRDWLKPTDIRTRRQLAQDMLRRLAGEGLTHVRYADGRKVSLEAYTDMSARTMAGQAAVQASMNRYAEYGFDLVRVSAHPRPSPMCQPWEGKVLSRTGDTDNYPTYAEAHAGGRGLHHPSCKHYISAYIEGVSPKEAPKILLSPEERKIYAKYGDQKGSAIMYQQEQQQRYLERQIRKWRYEQAAAITPERAAVADSKIQTYQARVRQHIKDNPYLRRRSDREQIGG